MVKLAFAGSALFLVAAGFGSRFLEATGARPEVSPTASIVQAAQAVLRSLDGAQREAAALPFQGEERFNWHFIPRARKGLPLKKMTPSQRQKTTDLLKASLSKMGVKTVEQVRNLESVLAEIEGNPSHRDPELYYLSFFGKPEARSRWGWRFEGHHLSLNFTLDGERVLSATPLFLGANPAIVRSGPKKGLRVLAGVEDRARVLMQALSPAQLEQALGKGKPEEVRGTRSPRYGDSLPAGLSADKLSEDQVELLEHLLKEYVRCLRRDERQAVLNEIGDEGVKRIQIAWRGSLKPFEGHSYIVHGPSFVISYANFQNGAAHVHSAFRDTKGEFGLD